LGHGLEIEEFVVEEEQDESASREDQGRQQGRDDVFSLFYGQTHADGHNSAGDEGQCETCLQTDQKYPLFDLIGRMVELSC